MWILWDQPTHRYGQTGLNTNLAINMARPAWTQTWPFGRHTAIGLFGQQTCETVPLTACETGYLAIHQYGHPTHRTGHQYGQTGLNTDLAIWLPDSNRTVWPTNLWDRTPHCLWDRTPGHPSTWPPNPQDWPEHTVSLWHCETTMDITSHSYQEYGQRKT